MQRVWAWNTEVLTWKMITSLLTKRSQTMTLISCDSIRRISNILILVGLSTLLTLNTENSRKGPPPLPTADVMVVFPFICKISEAFPDILLFSYLGISQFLIFIFIVTKVINLWGRNWTFSFTVLNLVPPTYPLSLPSLELILVKLGLPNHVKMHCQHAVWK